MGLFSIFRKNKQESSSSDGEFLTRTETESNAARGRAKRVQRKPANEAVDPALPEKKRARRRLMGAVALVMAAVIVLPMILDSEPKPLAADVAIQIPSKDSQAVRPNNAGASASSTTESRMPLSAGLDKGEEVVQPSSSSMPSQRNPADSSSIPDTANKSESTPKPASKLENKVTAQPIPLKSSGDLDRAKAILEGKTLAKAEAATAPSEAKAAAYLVQVAALASQDKVNELQSKLKNAGIKSHTQKVATANGDRIRVRVGPFANKEEADRMRVKIGKLGLNGTLVPA